MIWDSSLLASSHTIAHSVTTSPVQLWQIHHALSHLGAFTQALPSLAPSFPETHKAGPSPPPVFSLNIPSSERPFPPQHLQYGAPYWGPFTATLLTAPASAPLATTASSLSTPCLLPSWQVVRSAIIFPFRALLIDFCLPGRMRLWEKGQGCCLSCSPLGLPHISQCPALWGQLIYICWMTSICRDPSSISCAPWVMFPLLPCGVK